MANKKISLSELLIRFQRKHNNLYDYSCVKYINMHVKVKILCKIHGEFMQEPADHLAGRGCRKCGFDKCGSQLLNQKELIQKYQKIHNNKYDYSKVIYQGYRYKIEIICPVHGSFWQGPGVHIISRGCKKCATEEQAATRWLSPEVIILRLNKLHNNRYNYSNAVFKGVRSKIRIICPTHGEFNQVLSDHLAGRGCRKCPPNKKQYKNTHLYTDSVNEIDFLKSIEQQYGLEWLIKNVKIPEPISYSIENKTKKYYPDFQIENILYEIKSLYSWFEYRRHGNLEQINNAKLNAAFAAGYDVRLILDGIEMHWPVSVLKR